MTPRPSSQQRTPLPKKRCTPRRDEGRVTHKRMKPRNNPTVEQKRYWNSLVPYYVNCGAPDAVIHHIMEDMPEKQGRRDHWFVVRLCPQCHNMGTASVHLLGSEAEFKSVTGSDLPWIAIRNLTGWRARQ